MDTIRYNQPMRVDIFSLFPEVFQPYLEISILKRAIQSALLEVKTHNIRDWAFDRHHTTDDAPYGGGGGMIMKPEPPQGQLFNQQMASELASYEHLAMICGRYESVDERIREHLVTHAISIGDYVLTGGELPTLVVLDAVARLLPGVLGDPQATLDDSFSSGLLEYPHYTRPPKFRGWTVPEVLLSGNHAELKLWRRRQSLLRTLRLRPDLLPNANLSVEDQSFLENYQDGNSNNK